MDVAQLVELVRTGGSTGIAIALIIAGMKGWYVWKWQYDELKKRHDEWRDEARRAQANAAGAMAQAERSVEWASGIARKEIQP